MKYGLCDQCTLSPLQEQVFWLEVLVILLILTIIKVYQKVFIMEYQKTSLRPFKWTSSNA